MKQPQRLTLQRIFTTLIPDNTVPDRYYFKDGFGIAINLNRLIRLFINLKDSPYLLDDYRIGVVKRGYMRSIINLQEYRIEAGTLIFITPGTIVEPLDMSDDLELMGVGIPRDMFHIAHNGQLPDLFNGQQKHGTQKVSEGNLQILDHMFHLLWEIANEQQVAHNMICTITSYYNTLFERPQAFTSAHRSANDIFDRFIQLVNNHCKEQRQLAFYAEKLCITERYLGTVIRQTSGTTAKEWIDRAVITAAKVMLRHGNLQIAEITEQLHFPNPSFFCKYFKRLEGCTPQEYRLGKAMQNQGT